MPSRLAPLLQMPCPLHATGAGLGSALLATLGGPNGHVTLQVRPPTKGSHSQRPVSRQRPWLEHGDLAPPSHSIWQLVPTKPVRQAHVPSPDRPLLHVPFTQLQTPWHVLPQRSWPVAVTGQGSHSSPITLHAGPHVASPVASRRHTQPPSTHDPTPPQIAPSCVGHGLSQYDPLYPLTH